MRKIRVTRSVIPNLFTLMNLFCGFIALTRIAEHDFQQSVFFIVLAAMFDVLDGFMARLTKSTSTLGIELDSLCDAVSFGVAPSFMVYKAYFFQVEHFGLMLAALPAMAGVYRLARFNVQSGGKDKLYFRGMPIPAGALTIISYTTFYHITTAIPEEWKALAMTFVTLVVSATMVSTIKYDNFPKLSPRGIAQRPFVFAFFLTAGVASMATGGKLLFPFMMAYIIFGFLRQLVNIFRPTENTSETTSFEQPEPRISGQSK